MELNDMKNKNKLEIYTVPAYEGNAYIMETIDGYYDALWTAPIFNYDSLHHLSYLNGTVNNEQWAIVKDDAVINNVLDTNERIIIDEITVEGFVKLIKECA